jgi:hypothetical protein
MENYPQASHDEAPETVQMGLQEHTALKAIKY